MRSARPDKRPVLRPTGQTLESARPLPTHESGHRCRSPAGSPGTASRTATPSPEFDRPPGLSSARRETRGGAWTRPPRHPHARRSSSREDHHHRTLGSNNQLTAYGTKCLDELGTTAGARVRIWACTGGADRQWRVNPDGTITGVRSGLCLDVTGAATTTGTAAELWTCNGGSHQQWTRS
ncbi:RICIN domain-containing protein [Actinoplanes siamensis]|uniref:Ricin B lectin domain-containing protein n=1 Tax=Actinoplanes siamensis TaxID=1223317 RepID=A0A919N5L4_9ACTN|nr:RICIN domain-containing protein [Actinoplanes siamensis]GIF04820.1 hypothetical protein Asi03nite_23580 [Actinoplanes siamensis]